MEGIEPNPGPAWGWGELERTMKEIMGSEWDDAVIKNHIQQFREALRKGFGRLSVSSEDVEGYLGMSPTDRNEKFGFTLDETIATRFGEAIARLKTPTTTGTRSYHIISILLCSVGFTHSTHLCLSYHLCCMYRLTTTQWYCILLASTGNSYYHSII